MIAPAPRLWTFTDKDTLLIDSGLWPLNLLRPDKLVDSVKEIQQEYKDRDRKLELNELTSQLCSGAFIVFHFEIC